MKSKFCIFLLLCGLWSACDDDKSESATRLVLSADEVVLSAEKDSTVIQVSSEVPWNAEFDEWKGVGVNNLVEFGQLFSFTPQNGKKGETELVLKAGENDTYQKREGRIRVVAANTYKYIRFVQETGPYFELPEKLLEIEADRTGATCRVYTSRGVKVEKIEGDWINSPTAPQEGEIYATIALNFEVNEDGERWGKVILSSLQDNLRDTVIVVQSGK